MNIEREGSDVFLHGTTNLATANTPTQLTTWTEARKGITIKAPAGNSGTIYVGKAKSVTADNGFPLSANETVFVRVQDVSQVYVFNATANDTASWIVN